MGCNARKTTTTLCLIKTAVEQRRCEKNQRTVIFPLKSMEVKNSKAKVLL